MKAAAKSKRAGGFSMVEMVLTIVIISIALLAVINGLRTSTQHSADSIVQAKSTYLAEMLLEEILYKRFDENTGEGGLPLCTASGGANPCSTIGVDAGEPLLSGLTTIAEKKAALAVYDDVDDYHGQELDYAGLHANSSIYLGYKANVTVSYDGTTFFTATDGHRVKKVTVTITPPGETVGYPFSAYKGNY